MDAREFSEILLQGADRMDAESAFDHEERKRYINGSEAGTCIRKQWYFNNGADTDGPDETGYGRRGNWLERYMLECLRRTNIPMRFSGDDQVQLVDEERRISCTPDGLAEYADKNDNTYYFVPEFKTFDPRTNTDYLPKPEHVDQLRISMEMLDACRHDLPEPIGDAPITHGLIFYMNCSNFNDVRCFRVERDRTTLDRIERRAKKLLGTKKPERLPREGKEAGGRECRQRCIFNKVCGIDVDVSGMGTSASGRANAGSAFHTAVVSYVTAKAEEKTIEARVEKFKEEVKAELKRRKKEVLNIDGFRVALNKKAGRVSIDRQAAEDDGVDLSKYEKHGKPYEELKVTKL